MSRPVIADQISAAQQAANAIPAAGISFVAKCSFIFFAGLDSTSNGEVGLGMQQDRYLRLAA